MSNSYNKSSQFRTQVNQANVIKECYPCGSYIPCSQTIITQIPNDLTVSTLTVGGKATILGLIDPTGLEFTPVSTNPGNIQANTLWANSTNLNKLYYGNSAVGSGSGGVNVNAGTNISIPDPSIPVVSVAISATLDMVGNTLDNCPLIASSGDIVLSPVGVAKILNATPTLRFEDTTTTADLTYSATGSIFVEPSLITNVNEVSVATGAVQRVAMGYNTALQTSYVSGGGQPLFIGEDGANSYSGIVLGNGISPTNALFIDRKDDTNVTNSAGTIVLTGAGNINIESQLPTTGGISLATLGTTNIVLSSGQAIGLSASTDITLIATSGVVKVDNCNLDMNGNNIINGDQIELVSDTAQVYLSDATNTPKGSLNYASVNNRISLAALDTGTVLALTTASADLDLTAVGGHLQLLATGNPILIATNVDGLGTSGNIELTANGTGAISLTTGSTVGITGGNLDLNTNDLVDGGNLGAESMVLQSNLAKAEFKDGLGVLKGSMGYNSGTDFMDLTGSAGFEINTTAGALNMTANGGKINMITNGENIELFGNTTGGFFADVNIGSSDGDLDIQIGGNILMNAGTTGGNITVTAFADFSVSSSTVKLPTLPTASTEYQLFYDITSKDVTYGSAFPAITVQAATGTIALTAAMNRSTYILTGTSATQTFTDAGLSGVAAGWCVYLRNGNNATGLNRDITITITAGNTTLHAPTGTTNSSFILLYWNGSALVSYR